MSYETCPPTDRKVKKQTKTSTLKRAVTDRLKEIRISGEVVIANPGKANERSVLETTEWKDGKQIVTKIPLSKPNGV
jgi:hypothetical protein